MEFLKSGGVTLQHFEVDQVSVGPLTQHNIPSAVGLFPAQLENAFGFKLAGIISHKFFKHYALTIDFTGMRYFLQER